MTEEDEWPKMDKPSRRVRGVRGWAPSDVWNVDTYISGVLAGMLDYLANTTHSTPMGMDDVKWTRTLHEMAAGFRRWENHYNDADESDAYQQVRKSIRLLHRHFADLWD